MSSNYVKREKQTAFRKQLFANVFTVCDFLFKNDVQKLRQFSCFHTNLEMEFSYWLKIFLNKKKYEI